MQTSRLVAANADVFALEATVDRLQGTIGCYADQISQLCRRVDEHCVEIERLNGEVLDEGVEYCHEFGVDPYFIDVNDDLREDIHRAGAYLAPTVTITRQVVGSVMWVMATWQPPSMSIIYDVLPRMTLRIEVDPIGYATSPTPPKFKITHVDDSGDDVEFPVGKRIVNILVEYMRGVWGRSGFNPPCGATAAAHNASPVSASFSHDTDPRCVVPYVAEEGGLIAHLVRYAMLRMKTYADFCVICDQPILHNKGQAVTCGSVLCEYSLYAFRDVRVGHKAVGQEATPSTSLNHAANNKSPIKQDTTHQEAAPDSAAHLPHQQQPPFHFQGRFATVDVKYVPYTTTPNQRHSPYQRSSNVLSHIQVGNGHLDRYGRPVPEFCQRISSVLRELFMLEYVVCTCPSYKYMHYVDIYVISSAPLNMVPNQNIILPFLMDEHGYHTTTERPTPTTPATKFFEYAFVVGTPGSRAALMDAQLVSKRFAQQNSIVLKQAERHRRCGYQPTAPLKIKLCSAQPTSTTTFPSPCGSGAGPKCYGYYENKKKKK